MLRRSSFAGLIGVLLVVLAVAAGAQTVDPVRRLFIGSKTPLGTSSRVAPASAGRVLFTKGANSSFDPYTKSPSAAQQQWMRDHYTRMLTYSPYFDSRTSWFPRAWVYRDAYALYVNSHAQVVADHPDWVLRDASGNKLYIPYGCSNGSCPQFAGDFGNPAFRAWWIDWVKRDLARGYLGVFVDDVNMDWRVGNGSGVFVNPIDPRTGGPMTQADWRRYMAEFMEQVRQAMPTAEIVHNVIWYAGATSGADTEPSIARQLRAADVINLERGVNDSGITNGTGRFGYETFLGYVDRRHESGRSVVFDSVATTQAATEYGMASYLLVNNGLDRYDNNWRSVPDDWWSGYDVSLGSPRGPRYAWNGVLRRDFERGTVLVNQPGAATQTVSLPDAHTDLAGNAVTSVTLAAARGAVLLRAG